MATDWPDITELARKVEAHAELLHQHTNDGEAMKALWSLGTMHECSTELASLLVEAAAREGKTQKAIAEALGIPASTLRGLKQSL